MGFKDDMNYSFKGDKAYTEDDILVYNIFVYNIPKNATQEEVLSYFKQFGEVEKLQFLTEKKKSRKPKMGFVYFADPLVAATVLKQHNTHYLNSKHIYVKACDSWYQPKEPPEDITAEEEPGNNAQHKPSILILNDDCLEYIFKKLDLKAQVRFSLICQRFRDIFAMVCKAEHKTCVVDDLEPLTLWEIREFFKISGTSIESLIGAVPYKNRERIFELISRFCPNIKTINLDSNKLKSAKMMSIFERLVNVTVLELRDCSLNDHAILAFKKLPNLDCLTLSDNYELTGKHMNRLKTVTQLTLYGCVNIQSTYFIDLCKSLKDLKVLDIQRCERLSGYALNEMVTNCVNLASLKISCNGIQYECVAQLPSLKKLEVLSTSLIIVRQQLFDELANHKAQQLESLRVVAKNWINMDRVKSIARISSLKHLSCANNETLTDECLRKFGELENLEEIVLQKCRSITNDGLLSLLRKCTKLKKVNIQCCNLITDQFILEAIELLRSTKSLRPQEPCLFFIAKSGVNSYVMESSEYLDSTSLIKLSCYEPSILEHEFDDADDSENLDEIDYDDFFSDEFDDHDDPDDMFDEIDVDDIPHELNRDFGFDRYDFEYELDEVFNHQFW